ncbi:hypothetical protein [Dysgonomonas sp. 521]|nr:hypothetical protein [Dysgonomonas sp. 521]
MEYKKIALNIFCIFIIIVGTYLLGHAVGEAWANYDKSTKVESEK